MENNIKVALQDINNKFDSHKYFTDLKEAKRYINCRKKLFENAYGLFNNKKTFATIL